MPLVPFGDYRPDVSDYEGQTSQTIQNVVPRGDGYGPFPAFTALSGAMAAACRGAFFAVKSDGSITIFAGTSTKLYNMDNTTFAWTDVSKSGGTYSALSATDQWQFAQFNNFVFATQLNAPVQVFDLTSSTEFADLGGSPPQARYVSVVGRFLVLSGLGSSTPYRIQWSGLDDTTNWTSGTNSSDFQDLPDGGVVRGVAGGTNSGVIFQDGAIRTMTYAPGSPVIFQIDRLAQDVGLYAPYSLVRAGERIFFYSSKGFQMLLPGGYPTPIGKEKVDRTFFADLDKGNLQMFIGAADPRNSRVYWAYKSASGTEGLFDKIICYDYGLQKFTPIAITGEYLMPISQPGITLEALDSVSSSLDALTASLDSYATSVTPEIAAVSSAHILGFFRGDNLEATLDTAEQGLSGQRIYVDSFRPITDAPSLFGSASQRENLKSIATYSDETEIDDQGQCYPSVSTRYSRLRSRIPSGTAWTYINGVEPVIVPEGQS